MKKLAPIVLFTYNRLAETKNTISALQKNFLAKESDLIIFSDGPKSEKNDSQVNSVRNYLKTVNGFNSVTINASKENKGLANSIIFGVTQIINKYEKVIVLEDDLITSTNFLNFMNQGLDFYEHDEKIISISGYTFDLKGLDKKEDCFFGLRSSSWGWATWKNRWSNVEWTISDYNDFKNNKIRKQKFSRGGSDMNKMMKNQLEGKIDSWAIRFCYHQSKYDLISVFPASSKISNDGFGENATHTSGVTRFKTTLDESGKQEFNFKQFIDLDTKLVKEFAQKFSIKTRLIDKLKRLI